MPIYVSVVTLVRAFLTALALALVLMGVLAWRHRRQAPEAGIFTLLCISAAIYCFGYAGEMAQTTLSRAMFWLHVEYFGIPWVPALWLLGARLYKGLNNKLGLLFAIPLMTFFGQLSNSLHGLYDRSVALAERGPFWVVTVNRGPIAWLNLAYLNFALFYGAWLYLSRPAAPGRSRIQTLVMVAASLVPLSGYLVYLFGHSPWGLDLAPLLLGFSVVLGYIAVFRFRVFDMVPMARSLVFRHMRDAVVVSDLQHRLVDFNLAAREILPQLAKARPGETLSSVLKDLPHAAQVLVGPDGTQRLDLKTRGEKQHFDVRVFPLYHHKQHVGSAAVLANITTQLRLVDELQHTAETDALTGVANRRSFLSHIERECARASRYGEPFSVALVDIDRFKTVNDTLGHDAGDDVLLLVADHILQCLRASDLLSRYGGDEFALLLPQTNQAGAREVAERIRQVVAENAVKSYAGAPMRVTISIGLATLDSGQEPDWSQLLKHADKALYKAKTQGRNQVATWGELFQAFPN